MCLEIDKQLVNAGRCKASRQVARAARKAHRVDFCTERGIMWQNRERGRRWDIIHLSIDAMAKDKTTVPWTAKKGNKFESWHKNALEIKLVACILHGWRTFLFPIFEWIPQADNQSGGMIATMVHHVLRELCKEKPWLVHSKPMPQDLVIQWDGGSENRNYAIFSYVEYLCTKFFTNVYINRLPPGHTHNDCDQLFGVIWGHLSSKHGKQDFITIATMEDFISRNQSCIEKGQRHGERCKQPSCSATWNNLRH